MSEGAPKDVSKKGEEPTKIIEIGGKKFEVGPDLGEMSWDNMKDKVVKLNNEVLKSGEKEWRILTKEEYEELEEQAHAIWKPEVLSNKVLYSWGEEWKQEAFSDKGEYFRDEKRRKAKLNEFVTSLGLAPDKDYWSSTELASDKRFAYEWSTLIGNMHCYTKDYLLSVQCVREV